MPSAETSYHNPDLEGAGASLVRRLGGTWHGASGMCRCPAHDDRNPSLSVRVGQTRLLFKCFAGCDRRDVLRAIRRFEPKSLEASGAAVPPNDDLDAWLQMRAQDLWFSARPINGSLGEIYLGRRSIDIAPACLRFHHRTPLGKGAMAKFRPALLAAITDDSGLLAVQRSFLDSRGRRARDLGEPRRMLGRPGAGAVRLAPANDILGLAEGVETALSAIILLGIPVWAALGNERLPHVAVPQSVKHLILLPDNDAAGQLAVRLAIEAHAKRGRHIDTIWPWRGLNDWNDVLRAEREGGRRWRREVA